MINVLLKLFLIYQKAEDYGSSYASILELIYYMKKINSNLGDIQILTDRLLKELNNTELEKDFKKIESYITKINNDKSLFKDHEKLYNYLQVLRDVKGKPELEWPQWVAIAKIFEQSDQMKLALEAYKIAFKHLKLGDFASKPDWELSISNKINKLKNVDRP